MSRIFSHFCHVLTRILLEQMDPIIMVSSLSMASDLMTITSQRFYFYGFSVLHINLRSIYLGDLYIKKMYISN